VFENSITPGLTSAKKQLEKKNKLKKCLYNLYIKKGQYITAPSKKKVITIF
jgi:hypothetical protein